MRQLDLFGSFVDTSSPPEEQGEKVIVSIKKEEVTAVIASEETNYSLVGLAEEMLGAASFDDSRNRGTTGNDTEAHSKSEQPFSFASETSISFTRLTENLSFELPHHQVGSKGHLLRANERKLNQFGESEEVHYKNEGSKIKINNKFSAADETPGKSKKEPQKRGRKSLIEIEAEVDLIEVPEDEELFKKQYYPISEVAKWFRVNTSLLRFWENEFDILKPRKNRKGDRLFRPEDVKNLQLIYQLLRQRKYTIEGAKEYLKANKRKADIQLQLTTTLQKFKSFLLDLKTNL